MLNSSRQEYWGGQSIDNQYPVRPTTNGIGQIINMNGPYVAYTPQPPAQSYVYYTPAVYAYNNNSQQPFEASASTTATESLLMKDSTSNVLPTSVDRQPHSSPQIYSNNFQRGYQYLDHPESQDKESYSASLSSNISSSTNILRPPEGENISSFLLLVIIFSYF